MLRTDNGRKAISSVIRQCAPNTGLVTHLKKFALACKFFEYIFEPALSDQNSIFYGTGFHLYISTLMFVYFRTSDATAEELFENFAKLMRSGDPAALQKLFPSKGLVVDYTDNPLQAVSLFAMLNRRSVLEELDVIRGNGTEPNWVLDLTTTSLFSHLSHWAERFDTLEVYCDQSKPLEADAPFLSCMVGRTDHLRLRMFGKERQYTFNLVRPVELVDSKAHFGIQIADVMASAAARAFQNRYRGQLDENEREWLEGFEQSLLDDNIWPDFEHIDLRRPRPFVNQTLLLELTDRCLKKEDLFDGIPEIIDAAHAVYPRFYREEVQKESNS